MLDVGTEGIMEDIAAPAAPAIYAVRSIFSNDLIFGSGPLGLLAWVAVLFALISAIVVITRHILNPRAHTNGTYFFQIAHIVFLIVVHHLGVGTMMGIGYGPMSYFTSSAIQSVGIGTGILLACCLLVSLVTRTMPQPTLLPCLGGLAAIASIVVIIISLTLIAT